MQKIWVKLAVLLFTVVLLTGLDQWLKASLIGLKTHGLGSGLIKLVWYENPGIAFSINLPATLAVALVILLLIVLISLWFRAQSRLSCYHWGLLLTIAGGGSNLLDKLTLGFVRDFVVIGWLPVFNLADVFIFIGIILIIVGVLYGERRQKV